MQHEPEGFALLLVLWVMTLLAFLAAQVTGGGRAELRNTDALVKEARMQAAAEAAVYETIWYLLPGDKGWAPETIKSRLQEGSFEVAVSLIDQRGKLDINYAPSDLMASFFTVLGLSRQSAQDLGDTIVQWRTGAWPQDEAGIVRRPRTPLIAPIWGPPTRDFEHLEDLRLVPGMTAELYQSAAPHLVVHLGQGPLQTIADTVIRETLERNSRETHVTQAEPDPRGPALFEIRALVTEQGASFTRRAQVRFSGVLGNDRSKYRILAWERGVTGR